jgi:hypothetical protein
MKKYLLSIVLVVVMMSSFAGGKKPYYVKVKPSHPTVVVNMGPGPSPKHVWVDGYWVWRPGPAQYEWVEGSWAVPPPQHNIWVPGHWRKVQYGWYWQQGHWK